MTRKQKEREGEKNKKRSLFYYYYFLWKEGIKQKRAWLSVALMCSGFPFKESEEKSGVWIFVVEEGEGCKLIVSPKAL